MSAGERPGGKQAHRRSSRPVNRFPVSGRTGLLIGVACLLIVWLLSGFVVRAFSSGEVLDGTSMAGVDLGGATRESAEELIAGADPQQVKLTGISETVTVRAPQAGLLVDVEASAESAYSAGRSGIGAILKGPLVLFTERDLEPVHEPVDSKRLNRTVARVAEQVDREPFVGALQIDVGSLEVAITQPEAGVRVRRAATGEKLLQTFEDGTAFMSTPVASRPAPTPAEVRAVARDAERYLRRPLRIRTPGGPGRFTPQQLAGVLAVESAGEGADDGIQLGADREKLATLVAELASRRDRPARDAGLDTPPLPPVNLSEQGDLSWKPRPGVATAIQARTGRRIRQDRSIDNAIDAIHSDRHVARFPTEGVEPEVTTQAARTATSLLGTFTTSFSCCEPRVTNIQRMAETVDGTVTAPGEQFSLNGIAGERTRANGYLPAPTIGEGNKLIDTVGGGVSQFSTTAYNAAYFAGLQIDAHTPHSFYIDRYPPGRESTLNFGTIDLLWTNDTDAPVVVRSSASDDAVTVSIYGGNGDRKVRAETRSRSNNSKGGFDITIDRVIIDADGTRSREPYTTSYGLPAD